MKRVLTICLLLSTVLFAATGEPDIGRILEDIDNLGNFEGMDFSAVYTLVSEKPGEDVSITKARLFRRDDKDQFVLLILEPRVQKGQGYLQVDDTVWFYDPDGRVFEQSSLKDNVQGTDAQNSDFNTNSLADDYDVRAWEEGTLGNIPVWILDLKSKSPDAEYDNMKIWVRQDYNIVLMQKDYSVNGRLMRTSLFPKYITVSGKFIPRQILIQDEVNIGEKTQITIEDATARTIPDFVFTKAYLEQVNQ